jgi:hypothetical protein
LQRTMALAGSKERAGYEGSAELQMRIMQLAREGSPLPDCAYLKPSCRVNSIR